MTTTGPLDRRHAAIVAALASVPLLAALGASRLTPHEAIWAETAREMLASGDWLTPTIAGGAWLEKPPLATWLIAASGCLLGGVSEAAARLPSALAAVGLCLGVASIASRRFGTRVGLLAGCVQATMPWLLLRGRLAEVDVTLSALIVGAMAALDRLRSESLQARWAFFGLVGGMALAKGIVFGAVLVGASALVLTAWDRDGRTLRALLSPIGLGIALVLALAWPLRVLAVHPEALGLWTMHLTDRLAARPEHFAGEGWGEYLLAPMVQTLPWTPLAILGAWRSARRALAERGGVDRLLWAWAVVPSTLVSLASTRNGHYLIHALPPLAIWSALTLARVGEHLSHRGQARPRITRIRALAFAGLALAWAVGFAAIGPRINPRSGEYAFYERAGRLVPRGEPLVLLYDLERPDRWDKAPYPTPFGPVPADLAARLVYLDRPASWRLGLDDLRAHLEGYAGPVSVLGRERDAGGLAALGAVDVLARGPTSRWDRAYVLFRVRPPEAGLMPAPPRARRAGRADPSTVWRRDGRGRGPG